MLLFVSWHNKYAIIEWPLFDAPTSTHGAFTSFSLSKYCCLHFSRNKYGLILAQGYFKGQRSSFIHKLQIFMTLCDMQFIIIIIIHRLRSRRPQGFSMHDDHQQMRQSAVLALLLHYPQAIFVHN